MNNKTKYM